MTARCGRWSANLLALALLTTAGLSAQRGAPADGEWPTYGPSIWSSGEYDKATGAELASTDLPGGAIGTPMTYLLDGRQYIALTVGGARVPELVALALPAAAPAR